MTIPTLAFALTATLLGVPATAQPTAPVDPFIGTAGEGHVFPGAVAPFGMVRYSPDTLLGAARRTYNRAAGYRHEDATILGFSHTHFSGAGHSDLSDFLVMPVSGNTVPLEPEIRPNRGRVIDRARPMRVRRPAIMR